MLLPSPRGWAGRPPAFPPSPTPIHDTQMGGPQPSSVPPLPSTCHWPCLHAGAACLERRAAAGLAAHLGQQVLDAEHLLGWLRGCLPGAGTLLPAHPTPHRAAPNPRPGAAPRAPVTSTSSSPSAPGHLGPGHPQGLWGLNADPSCAQRVAGSVLGRTPGAAEPDLRGEAWGAGWPHQLQKVPDSGALGSWV